MASAGGNTNAMSGYLVSVDLTELLCCCDEPTCGVFTMPLKGHCVSEMT